MLVVSGCDYLPKAAAAFVEIAIESGFPVLFSSRAPLGVSDVTPAENDAPLQILTIPAEDITLTHCESKAYPAFHSPEKPDLAHGMGGTHPDFSGYYRYEFTVRLPIHKRPFLEINDVHETSEVFVAGQSAGLLTAPPYRFNLSGLTADGSAAIAIEVATTLERKAAAMGVDLRCLNFPSPLSPTGIVGCISIVLFWQRIWPENGRVCGYKHTAKLM
ncbi:MAG TPA: hypothetical protein DEB31_04495 [Clostridiales bacterium]|nr:hypothetical protein [Clostridiales bacterium]